MTNQTPKNKEFDCIEEKRKAQAKISEKIKGLSSEKEIEFFNNAAKRWKARVTKEPVEHQ